MNTVPCAPGQPADQGPLSDIALGDEGGRQQGVDDENVDEGYVVADQQSALHAGEDVGARRFDANAPAAQELARPDTVSAAFVRIRGDGGTALQTCAAPQQQVHPTRSRRRLPYRAMMGMASAKAIPLLLQRHYFHRIVPRSCWAISRRCNNCGTRLRASHYRKHKGVT
jgi:hypothetical protein